MVIQMKKIILLFVFILSLTSNIYAFPLTTQIFDNYVGATTSNPATRGQDVVGNSEIYDISKANVIIKGPNSDNIVVEIFTKAVGFGALDNARLGALFISSNGWRPYGNAPHIDDNHFNGEQWEYVMPFSSNYTSNNGDVSKFEQNLNESPEFLFSVDSANIVYTSGPNGDNYRAGQEFAYNRGSSSILGSGFVRVLEAGEYDILQFSIRSSYLVQEIMNNGGLAFHWTTNKGNDVIQGYAPVPEPFSLTIFGIGLFSFLRRRYKENYQL